MENKPGVAKVNTRNDLRAQEHGTDSGIVYPQVYQYGSRATRLLVLS
jgi:hypothetical protein